MNAYAELQGRHQDEFEKFPMVYAFGQNQIDKTLKKLGLNPEDTDKVSGFGDTGGIYLRSDESRLREMLERHERERQQAIADDTTGKGYIFHRL